MEEKYLSIVEISKLLGTKYPNVWAIVKKLNVKRRFTGFRKKEYNLSDFAEKLKKHNPEFYQLNEKKFSSLINKDEENGEG